VFFCVISTSNLPDAVTLGGACNRAEAFPVGLQDHVICCSGLLASSSNSIR